MIYGILIRKITADSNWKEDVTGRADKAVGVKSHSAAERVEALAIRHHDPLRASNEFPSTAAVAF